MTTVDRRTLRAEQKRSERRDAILLAAESVFCARGYSDASIADVIDAAQISRGTFYLYFDSKDALYLELIERFTGLVTKALQVVDTRDPDPAARILENVRRIVDVALSHPELTQLVLRESRGLNQALDERLDRLYDFLHSMVVGVLVNGASCGLTRKVYEPVIATALIGAFKEVFLHHLAPEGPRIRNGELLAQALFEFGVRGLLATRPAVSSAG
ncbi:MAG: TetR/AcrR family transcriptional regulator [Polyangiales bacterium]